MNFLISRDKDFLTEIYFMMIIWVNDNEFT